MRKPVVEETNTGAVKLQELVEGEVSFSAIHMNDCVTKAKSDEEHDCGRSVQRKAPCAAIEVLIAEEVRARACLGVLQVTAIESVVSRST